MFDQEPYRQVLIQEPQNCDSCNFNQVLYPKFLGEVRRHQFLTNLNELLFGLNALG